ncbi:uncharacterized protein [Agelaius tricolor]|uniref:uncharacterized protein isoform X4 n=1 Tax=Agelaius tricolor TaxID=9191 RepID=UPI0039F1BB48
MTRGNWELQVPFYPSGNFRSFFNLPGNFRSLFIFLGTSGPSLSFWEFQVPFYFPGNFGSLFIPLSNPHAYNFTYPKFHIPKISHTQNFTYPKFHISKFHIPKTSHIQNSTFQNFTFQNFTYPKFHIPKIPHTQNFTFQNSTYPTFHVPNIPRTQHSTYPKFHIPNIPRTQHSTYPTFHVPNISRIHNFTNFHDFRPAFAAGSCLSEGAPRRCCPWIPTLDNSLFSVPQVFQIILVCTPSLCFITYSVHQAAKQRERRCSFLQPLLEPRRPRPNGGPAAEGAPREEPELGLGRPQARSSKVKRQEGISRFYVIQVVFRNALEISHCPSPVPHLSLFAQVVFRNALEISHCPFVPRLCSGTLWRSLTISHCPSPVPLCPGCVQERSGDLSLSLCAQVVFRNALEISHCPFLPRLCSGTL